MVHNKPTKLEKEWFRDLRHTEKIEAHESDALDREVWSFRRRTDEKTRTISVAIVLCLNIGVDPPDAQRASSSRKLSWIEPILCSASRSAQRIATSLQRSYEKLHPKARYKTSIDPSIDTIKKMTMSLRRNAKDERVLFHFNGYGVPRPTDAGEIWVFNRNITQYLPLSLYDLQSWMGSPSVYIWDCNSAGTIVNMFSRFVEEQQMKSMGTNEIFSDDTYQLAACRAGEILPQHPDLPADLFTSCLVTPIHTSLLWYIIKNGAKSQFPDDILDNIPGELTDRRTILGELNWIFTAITDTIAWNTLDTDTFHKLFRQDLLTASLFRSFLLAEKLMLENNCRVVSQPSIPSVASHPLWEYWDYTLDICLHNLSKYHSKKDQFFVVGTDEFYIGSKLPHSWLIERSVNQSEEISYNNFFSEHLKSFEIWLMFGIDKQTPPSELPVILQVLLSQTHRLKALNLLAKFVDLGPWAVSAALSVGIFPYMKKLLQSSGKELRGPLSFIWSKIIFTDPFFQQELVKENRYYYFITVLNNSTTTPRMKIVPAVIMAFIIHNQYRAAQEKIVHSEYMSLCMELLMTSEVAQCKLLCQWLLIGLGLLWTEFDKARWYAVRNVAYERVMEFLSDEVPEVRASAVFALGRFVRNRSANNEHAITVDNEVCDKICEMCSFDGSVLVRAEVLVAIQWYIIDFDAKFAELCNQLQKLSVLNKDELSTDEADDCTVKSAMEFGKQEEYVPEDVKKQILMDLQNLQKKTFKDPFERIWLSVLRMCFDPFPYVRSMARRIVNHIRRLAKADRQKKSQLANPMPTTSRNANEDRHSVRFVVGSPASGPASHAENGSHFRQCSSISDLIDKGDLDTLSSYFTTPKRNIYGSQSGRYARITDELIDQPVQALVMTQFVEWCLKAFQLPIFDALFNESCIAAYNSLVDPSRPYRESKPSDWALHTFDGLEQRSTSDIEEFKNEKLKCETLYVNINTHARQNCLAWSLLRPYILTSDGANVQLFSTNKEHAKTAKKGSFMAVVEPILKDPVTEIITTNSMTRELIITGSQNGIIKIWDPMFGMHGCEIEGDTQLITAADVVGDLQQSRVFSKNEARNSYTLYKWDEPMGRMICTGNLRVCRIWDAWSEKKLRDIEYRSKTPSFVTSIAVDLNNNLITAGFKDGALVVLDCRLPSSDCEVLRSRDFLSAVKAISLKPNDSAMSNGVRIIAGSCDGDFRVWDPRMFTEPVIEYNVFRHGLVSTQIDYNVETPVVHNIDIQTNGSIISCSTGDGFIRMFDLCGKKCLSQVKYSTGTHVPALTAMKFHPHKVMLGYLSVDAQLRTYGTPGL